MPFDNLDQIILSLSNHTEDTFTRRDSFEGIQIFGGSGSGKSTGSGEAFLNRYLQLGYGGLILTVKPEERKEWEEHCARNGRSSDLLILDSTGRERFDFLKYESERTGLGAGDTNELAQLFTTVLEAGGKGGNGSGDPYWSRAVSQLMKNTIDFAKLATGYVKLKDLATIIHEAPEDIEATTGKAWNQLVRAASGNAKTTMEQSDVDLTLQYFNREFPRLGEKLRSSIVSMFTSMADVLLRGTVGQLFSGGSYTFTPEQSHEGRLILIDLPVKNFGETGRFSQLIFKYIWQKAAERRNVQGKVRPLFLWCDESQELVTTYDAAFQTTARSSGVATVYLTQNIRNYHARMGSGAKAEADTDSLLGNLGTKIFHANGDWATNQFAERIFGYNSRQKFGGSVSHGDLTTSWNDSTEPTVPAKTFTMLRKGGTRDDRKVDGIVFQQGRTWKATGDNYLKVIFEQPKQ